jgi:hypothetical protein
LKRTLSALAATALLAAPLSACGSGGETDDGNSGQDTPTAVPTNDDGDAGDPEGSQNEGKGSGDE